jgi:hypothetical protein
MHASHMGRRSFFQEREFNVADQQLNFIIYNLQYHLCVCTKHTHLHINTTTTMPAPRVIYWFRTDLRLHDSPALKVALDMKPECLYPIWTWDPHYVYRARVGPNRWQYLLDCQADLSASITKLNPKAKLLVIRESPQTLYPKLFKAWRITHRTRMRGSGTMR